MNIPSMIDSWIKIILIWTGKCIHNSRNYNYLIVQHWFCDILLVFIITFAKKKLTKGCANSSHNEQQMCPTVITTNAILAIILYLDIDINLGRRRFLQQCRNKLNAWVLIIMFQSGMWELEFYMFRGWNILILFWDLLIICLFSCRLG